MTFLLQNLQRRKRSIRSRFRWVSDSDKYYYFLITDGSVQVAVCSRFYLTLSDHQVRSLNTITAKTTNITSSHNCVTLVTQLWDDGHTYV